MESVEVEMLGVMCDEGAVVWIQRHKGEDR